MRTVLAALLLLTPLMSLAQQPKAMFFLQNNADGVRSFQEHKGKIDTLVPTWYDVTPDGLVAGSPNQPVLDQANAAHIQVIPIFTLMSKEGAHKLLANPQAQDGMIAGMLRECKNHGYAGVQFDFENISWTDRDALSAMVARTADALHKEHLLVEIDVVPNAPGYPGQTHFSQWIFEDWRGVFDLKALAQSVDLLCLMTYDQHTRYTVPGPVAGWGWTEENLKYALQYVPKQKLSLGIPLYGYHWFTGDPGLGKPTQSPNPTADYISAADTYFLRDSYGAQAQWDPIDHTAFLWFYRDQMREWIFWTDRRGFEDRYNLVKQNGLQGFCSWVLGQEDPAIWDALPARR